MFRPNRIELVKALEAANEYIPHRQSKWLWAWPVYEKLRQRQATHAESIDFIFNYFALDQEDWENLANSMACKLSREKKRND
jgi:hypothetical protein